MRTVLHIYDKELVRKIEVVNPTAIPRIGDQINIGVEPAPTVSKVLWNFKNGSKDIEITVVL